MRPWMRLTSCAFTQRLQFLSRLALLRSIVAVLPDLQKFLVLGLCSGVISQPVICARQVQMCQGKIRGK